MNWKRFWKVFTPFVACTIASAAAGVLLASTILDHLGVQGESRIVWGFIIGGLGVIVGETIGLGAMVVTDIILYRRERNSSAIADGKD